MHKQKNKLQILVTLVFLGFVAWWVSFQSVVENQGLSAQWFEGTYGLMALAGSLIGFSAARKWGGLKTVLGKSLALFSFSLLAQEAGQLIYQYYIYGQKIDIPYPSLGDIAYFGSVLIYILAAVYLAKAAGVRFSLKKTSYKAVAVLLPILLLAVSYTILLRGHQYDTSHPLTVFLDAGYPIGEAIYISIAIVAYLLSRKMLGGLMKSGILLIIIALFFQYAADFTFVYQSNRETYVPGQYADLLYLIAYFAMTTALIRFHTIYSKLRSNTQTAPASSEETT